MVESLDTELFARLQQGDEDAFRILFEWYYYKIKQFIVGFTKNEAVAEDLTQNVFMKI